MNAVKATLKFCGGVGSVTGANFLLEIFPSPPTPLLGKERGDSEADGVRSKKILSPFIVITPCQNKPCHNDTDPKSCKQYFRNAVMLVIEDPDTGSTLLDVSRVLSNKQFRELKLANCKNPIVVQFWREVAEKAGGEASLANIVPYITSKFDVFLSNDIMRPIIAQEQSTFNFREIMDSKKILLVNLAKGRLGDINANLIGLILVGKMLMAALSRADSLDKNPPPFYLYIDEFQNVTTDSIATILSEARKYKLSLNVAHQFIAQLEENIKNAVFGNIGSIAAFRVGADDAEYLEKQFAPVFTASDIINIENRQAYLKLLINGHPVKPFNIETLPPPQGKAENVEKLKELSYLKYGNERSLVETDIMEKYRKAAL